MSKNRITLSVLIMAVALVVVVLHRYSRSDEIRSLGVSSNGSVRPHPTKTKTRREPFSTENVPHGRPVPSANEKVMAMTGDRVVLKVYADRTFQVHLPDITEDVFVPVGKELFAGDSLPDGVRIKIRNSVGEIFTVERGYGIRVSYGPEDLSWYRPGSNRIEMPVFSSRLTEEGEAIVVPGSGEPVEPVSGEVGARISSRGKLSDLIFGLSPRIRRQSGLEFKLAIFPFAIPNARDSDGEYLSSEDFPRHETDWLDGDLLFDDE